MLAAKTGHRLAMMAAFVCVIAVAGCGEKQGATKPDEAPAKQAPADPKAPVAKQPETQPPTPTLPKPPANLADAKVDVTYPINEYEAKQRKNHFFLCDDNPGKVIEVTGVVKSFGSFEDNRLVSLESDSPIGTMFKLADSKAWVKMLPRQTVTLRTVAPTTKARYVVNWQVITVTGTPTPTVTAEEFLKESKGGLNAVAEKHGKGWIIVSGTIVDVKVDTNGTTVQLAAEKDEKMTCFFSALFAPIPMTEAQQKALKPGLKVKILGDPSISQMISCVLLEPAP